MDTLLFAAVVEALAKEIAGQRVGIVVHPSPLWVEIGLGRGTLVFVLNPDNPVVFLSSRPPSGTKERSHFAWVLEQRLKGGRVKGVFRCSGDRVLGVVVSVRDRIGRVESYTLVAEIMGRHSNLVLLNQEGKVVEPLKKVHPDMSRVRHVLPGSAYHPPPPLKRMDPLTLNRERFLDIATSEGDLEEALKGALSLPAYAVREIVRRMGDRRGPEALLSAWEAWQEMRREVFKGRGYISQDGRLCTPFSLTGVGARELPLLKAVELFFEERQHRQALEGARRELVRALRRKVKSTEKAIAKERVKAMEYAAEEAQRYQRWGEVILIHLNSIPKGCKVLEAEDPFEPGNRISIPLEDGVPPTKVAQGYFKKAAKIRRKQEAASRRLEELEQIKGFLDSLLWSVESAESLEELKALRRELVREGLLEKGKVKAKRQERDAPRMLPYRVFLTQSGTQILVGRHPKGNEQITFKVASRFDLWFHARDFPGAHVILRDSNPAEEDIEKAAALAAYFSRARNSPKVEVVFTQRRYVKHPPKAPKGFVLYSKERSIAVVPCIPEGVVEKG